MVKLKYAVIPEGHSKFETDANAADIDLLESSEFTNPVHIAYDFNKVSNDVFVKTVLTTAVDLICDVCLDSYELNLNEAVDILLTKDKDIVDQSEEDVYLVADSTTDIDITDSVRQSLLLAIPFKKTCRQNCKGLCPICGTNLNHRQCSCIEKKMDSRWEALKNITFDNE